MSAETLLEWMTHLGSGRWGAFRDAVGELFGVTDSELYSKARNLRLALSDLGHADFFVGGTRRWRARAPGLLNLVAGRGDEAVLGGGRGRHLVEELKSLAAKEAVEVREIEQGLGLRQIRLRGNPDLFAAIAEQAGIAYVPSAANRILAELVPVRELLERTSPGPEPINWAVRSWSFGEMVWVDGKLSRTAREYTSRYGERRSMVDVGNGLLIEIEKRRAVFAAALLRREGLVSYNTDKQRLSVPIFAPLPELGARAACLSAGRLATIEHGWLQYEQVPVDTAAVLLTTVGQAHPLQGAVRL